MFRRSIDGVDYAFDVIGIWGNGNVVTERNLSKGGNSTAYSMWDGHALFGRRRPGGLVRYPSLYGTISLADFLERFESLDDDCKVWSGEELLGLGCKEACQHLESLCEDRRIGLCAEECASWPRAIIQCVAGVRACGAESSCGIDVWEEKLQNRE